MSTLAMAAFGFGFGAFVALSIFLANLVALKFSQGNALLDLLVRLGTFGVLVIAAGEVIGSFFGPQVRQQAPWFWGGFAFGLVAVPSLMALYVRRRDSR
jgi:hypothetical protein